MSIILMDQKLDESKRVPVKAGLILLSFFTVFSKHFLSDFSLIFYIMFLPDKGKPIARWGRKTTGPPEFVGGQPGCRMGGYQ